MAEYEQLKKEYYRLDSAKRDSKILEIAESRREGDSTYKTGITIRSGEVFLAMPRQLTALNERMLRVERKVSHLWRDLPGIAQGAFLRDLILNEIFSTNEIEGVYSTRRQIAEALESAEQKQDAHELKRFREFARLYLQLTDKNPLVPESPRDIRTIYEAVVAGELDEKDMSDGELFRNDPVEVRNPAQKILHTGVMPESRIYEMLEQMIALAASDEIPPTFSAILAHFLFEYIHPFYDGNGRTGRYLLALYLSEPLSLTTVLSLSSVISENKNAYYEAFTEAEDLRNHAELTFFVIQIIEFIRIAQEEVMESLTGKKRSFEKASDRLEDLEKSPYGLSKKELNVVLLAIQTHLFGAFPEISLEMIAEHAQVSAQTARKYCSAVEEAGLFKVISKKPLKFELTEKALEALSIEQTSE